MSNLFPNPPAKKFIPLVFAKSRASGQKRNSVNLSESAITTRRLHQQSTFLRLAVDKTQVTLKDSTILSPINNNVFLGFNFYNHQGKHNVTSFILFTPINKNFIFFEKKHFSFF